MGGMVLKEDTTSAVLFSFKDSAKVPNKVTRNGYYNFLSIVLLNLSFLDTKTLQVEGKRLGYSVRISSSRSQVASSSVWLLH